MSVDAEIFGGQPILSVAQMRLAEAAGASGSGDLWALMDRAGFAVAVRARAAAQRRKTRRIALICGPGGNGGDGLACAYWLRRWGFRLDVRTLGDPADYAGSALRALARFRAAGGRVRRFDPGTAIGDDLVIDALFGLGLRRPLTGLAAQAVEAINAASARGAFVLAVDLPSGLAGDDPRPPGPAVRATQTITFFRPKLAHALLPARDYCGVVEIAPIGLIPAVLDTIGPVRACFNQAWPRLLPRPALSDHKHRRGRVGVVTGGALSTGAARLAARAALRVGAGLVTLLAPAGAAFSAAAQSTAVMVRRFDDAGMLAALAEPLQAIVIGPALGLDAEARRLVVTLCAWAAADRKRVLALDADALTLFAGQMSELAALIGPNVVLSPHEGEFERLFPGLLGAAPDKIAAAQQAAESLGAVLVLKGADSVIAAPGRIALVNAAIAPYLATAGSGDVLIGAIAGLAAQGLAPFDAARAGVGLHAAAGAARGAGLIAEDLPEAMAECVRGAIGS